VWQGNPVASGAMRLNVVLEHGVLLRRPWPLLHRRLVTAGSSTHLLLSLYSMRLVGLFPGCCAYYACGGVVVSWFGGHGVVVDRVL
jgi:hypothetical protein